MRKPLSLPFPSDSLVLHRNPSKRPAPRSNFPPSKTENQQQINGYSQPKKKKTAPFTEPYERARRMLVSFSDPPFLFWLRLRAPATTHAPVLAAGERLLGVPEASPLWPSQPLPLPLPCLSHSRILHPF